MTYHHRSSTPLHTHNHGWYTITTSSLDTLMLEVGIFYYLNVREEIIKQRHSS
jgi:hypothetical protein